MPSSSPSTPSTNGVKKSEASRKSAVSSKSTPLPELLAEKIGGKATARSVFAEPLQQDGLTVIPVAKVRYGLGGGSGSSKEGEEGVGGGGAAQVTPLGFIEVRDGKTRFRKIYDVGALVRVVAFASLAIAFMALRRPRVMASSPAPESSSKESIPRH